jgi:hypothetical protein
MRFSWRLCEEYDVLGSNDMHFEDRLTFRRNLSPPSSGSKSKPSKKPAGCKELRLLAASDGFLLPLLWFNFVDLFSYLQYYYKFMILFK